MVSNQVWYTVTEFAWNNLGNYTIPQAELQIFRPEFEHPISRTLRQTLAA
jgi:hypothetical protein